MKNTELEALLDLHLNAAKIQDYCPNGLQIEGKTTIKKIITGVTACQALIEKAIELQADAILVHHGYFWRGEAMALRGMKYRRIKALIENGINLFAYHLPLDVHPELGNNAQLAQQLGIELEGGLELTNPNSVAMRGKLITPMLASEFATLIERKLARAPLHIASTPNQDKLITTIGCCTGGGQDYIDLAAKYQLDAFISGEISERTTFAAREQGIDYFAAGHHATERGGVRALGEWLKTTQGFDVTFVDIHNPV